MTTKTWKLGEVCQGGIITVEIQGKVIIVIGKEWDYSKGTRKNSDQSNAKEFTRGTVLATEDAARRKLDQFISNLTTSYHTGQIIKWIESKVTLNNPSRW